MPDFVTLAVQFPAWIGSLGALWDSVWPYLVMLAGFSAIIFVHELGHFAVAKWADVRVEKFAIGFGREIIGFTRGETRYSLNFLPLGGYVKMLGQEDFDDKTNELKFKEDPRSFVNKPVAHRMAIVSAGVIMNIVFACLLFMIVFLIGMDGNAPRIAFVEPDSPADRAGIQSGDLVKKVNGKGVLEFEEVMMAIFLSPPHEPVELIVERNGELAPPIRVQPEYRQSDGTRDPQRQIIGIGPGFSREIVGLGSEVRDGPMAPKVGDVIVEVDGIRVTDDNLNSMRDLLGYTSGPIVVERKNPKDPAAAPQLIEVRIPPLMTLFPADARDADSASVLGLCPLPKIGAVDPRGRAFLAGLDAGDTVLAWDDQPFPTSAQVAASVRDNAEKDISFVVQKPDGRRMGGSVRPKVHARGSATIQALIKPLRPAAEEAALAVFAEVRPGGIADKAGISHGDRIIRCNDQSQPALAEVHRILREGQGKKIRLELQKADGKSFHTIVVPIAPGSIDASYSQIADNELIVGRVLDTIHGRPTPAAQAGILRGSRILAVNEQPVSRWRDLIDRFREHAGATVSLSMVDVDKQKRSVPFTVPHCLRTLLGVGPEARILTVGGRDSIRIETTRGKETVSARYHEGTRTLLTELAGQRQVPIEFRRNVMSPVETRLIDVSEDMLDPWLGRVAFAPNAALAAETRLLKGANPLDAIRIGVHKTYYFVVQVYQFLHRMIFSRTVSAEAMSGPLGILDVGGKFAQSGGVRFLFFLAIISANLAVINFLPLPIVDGGLMVFLLIEWIKGSPVNLRVQVATQMIGIFLIIGMFLFVTYNDIIRMFG